jgi:hypothetical protein
MYDLEILAPGNSDDRIMTRFVIIKKKIHFWLKK